MECTIEGYCAREDTELEGSQWQVGVQAGKAACLFEWKVRSSVKLHGGWWLVAL